MQNLMLSPMVFTIFFVFFPVTFLFLMTVLVSIHKWTLALGLTQLNLPFIDKQTGSSCVLIPLAVSFSFYT